MSGDRPLAIDLFCGLSGWGHGLVAAGWHVIGFDIENMFDALDEPKPGHFNLVLQDVLTLHGRQFRDAQLIVGIHHWVSPKHLDRYVGEMTYRLNRRPLDRGERVNDLLAQVEGPLPYKVLIA